MLSASENYVTIKQDAKKLAELTKRYGKEALDGLLAEHGLTRDSITAPEINLLARFRDADAFRNRLAKSRQEAQGKTGNGRDRSGFTAEGSALGLIKAVIATVEPVSRDWGTTLASYYTWIVNDVRRSGVHVSEYRDDFHGFAKMELISRGKSAVVTIGGDSVDIEFSRPGQGVHARDTYYKRYPSLHAFNRAAAQSAADAIKQFFHGAVTATVEPGTTDLFYPGKLEIPECDFVFPGFGHVVTHSRPWHRDSDRAFGVNDREFGQLRVLENHVNLKLTRADLGTISNQANIEWGYLGIHGPVSAQRFWTAVLQSYAQLQVDYLPLFIDRLKELGARKYADAIRKREAQLVQVQAFLRNS